MSSSCARSIAISAQARRQYCARDCHRWQRSYGRMTLPTIHFCKHMIRVVGVSPSIGNARVSKRVTKPNIGLSVACPILPLLICYGLGCKAGVFVDDSSRRESAQWMRIGIATACRLKDKDAYRGIRCMSMARNSTLWPLL